MAGDGWLARWIQACESSATLAEKVNRRSQQVSPILGYGKRLEIPNSTLPFGPTIEGGLAVQDQKR